MAMDLCKRVLVSGSFICEPSTYIHIQRKITSFEQNPWFPYGDDASAAVTAVTRLLIRFMTAWYFRATV